MLTGVILIQIIQKRTFVVQDRKSIYSRSDAETVWLSHNLVGKDSFVQEQEPTITKPKNLSHNVYWHNKVGNHNILNHIINTTDQTRLVSNGERRFSPKEIFTYVLEFAALLIAFGVFVFFISISDGLDQHMIEWMGR